MSLPAGRKMSLQTLTEQFKCCICLDIYTDPVLLPCTHNFCLKCIQAFWDTKKKCECPLCKKTYKKRPTLRINREFADIIEALRSATLDEIDTEAPRNIVSLPPTQQCITVPCDICHGSESKSVKSCLVCQESYCEMHLAPHSRVPALKRHPLINPDMMINSHVCREHGKPLTLFCKTDHKPVCSSCTQGTHRRHEVIPMEKESKRIKNHMKATKLNIQQMIHTRQRKMEEITKAVEDGKEITEWEIQRNGRVCTTLMKAIQKHYTDLVTELQEKQNEAEQRANEILEKLEQEISDLHTRTRELQQLEFAENPVHLIQGFPSLSILPTSQDWSEVTVQSDNTMWTLKQAVSKLSDVCQQVTYELSLEEADKMKQYADDVTLDPETASGWLLLSPDGKKVSVSSQKRKASLPDSPQRFDACVCVLGKQSFTSGRHYWVVQVGNKTDWDLGVVRKSINRKGTITVCPESGFWAICRRKGGLSLSACARPSVTLHLQEIPQNVGIFLDIEEGSVSFYDADTKSHIYTYSDCSFTEHMYPYFNPCVLEDGKNSEPLAILPLSTIQEGMVIGTEV